MRDYIVDYILHTKTEVVKGIIKVKRCIAPIQARVKLEAYMKKKHADFDHIEITRVRPDIPDIFTTIFG